MKKNFLWLVLLLIVSCQDNSSQQDSEKDIVLKEDFISDVTKIDHIENKTNTQSNIYIFFNTEEVKQLSQKDPSLKVEIHAKITNGTSDISVDPQNLQLKIADILNGQKSFFTLNTKANSVGNYNIQFLVSVNNIKLIKQKVELNFYLSHRIISDFKSDKPLYMLDKEGSASLTVQSDYPDDHFFVSLEASSGIKNVTKSCEFPKDFKNKACNISFTVVAKDAIIQAKILDETGLSKALSINVCGYNENKIYISEQNNSNEIGYNKDLSLQIGRCATADAMENPLDAKLHFYDDSSHQEISINKIIAIQGHEQDASFHFNTNEDLIALVLTRSSDAKPDSFKFQLPGKMVTMAVAPGYLNSKNIPITNIDLDFPRVSLDSKLVVTQGSSVTVGFKRDNIEKNTMINFNLLQDDGKTFVPETKYKISENSDLQNISLELNSNDKLDKGNYLLVAYLSIAPDKPITISGDTIVEVLAPQIPKFNIIPNKKHVLKYFSSEIFYLAIDNNSQALSQTKQYKSLANQRLFLYGAENQDNGCDGIFLKMINNTNPTQDGQTCHLGTIDDFSKSDICSCTLNNAGKFDEKCVFKVFMPDHYGQDKPSTRCQINFGTQTDLNLAIPSDVVTTDGLPAIHILMENSTPSENNPFPYSGRMRMYSDGQNKLNENWVITPDKGKIKDGSLFKDELFFTQKEEYFSFPTNSRSNDFIINNYPGRNNVDTTQDILLPEMKFTLGVVFIYKGQEYSNWGTPDTCPSANDNSGFLPNLGCNRGGDNKLYPINENWRSSAYFPGNTISVNKSGVSTASGELIIPSGWYTDYHKPSQPKVHIRQFYKKDNKTVNVKLA